jgi:hypothetical protein
MASYPQPNIYTYKSDSATISVGMVVKAGSDEGHVALAAAATDKSVGIAMSPVTAAEDAIEVAMAGGGAKGLLGGTVAFGDYLASDAAGKLVATTTANDKVVAQALQAGVVNDLISVQVVSFNY